MLRLVSCYLLAAVLHAHAVEIIAHRGASYDAPENTLASVKLGWKRQADAVEVDVFLSKDNRIVAIHNKNTNHTTGHDGLVKEMKWSELQKLDAGSWKDKKYKGEQIPLLSDILATIPKGKYLVIEIKCGPEIVQPLADLFKKANLAPEKTTIISFSYDVVLAVKKKFPRRMVHYLSSLKKDKISGELRPSVESLVQKAIDAKLDGVSIGNMGFDGAAENDQLSHYLKKLRNETKKWNFGLYAWTVNDPRIAQALISHGFDGITTDRPLYLRNRLK